jgi:hypothetical protein
MTIRGDISAIDRGAQISKISARPAAALLLGGLLLLTRP